VPKPLKKGGKDRCTALNDRPEKITPQPSHGARGPRRYRLDKLEKSREKSARQKQERKGRAESRPTIAGKVSGHPWGGKSMGGTGVEPRGQGVQADHRHRGRALVSAKKWNRSGNISKSHKGIRVGAKSFRRGAGGTKRRGAGRKTLRRPGEAKSFYERRRKREKREKVTRTKERTLVGRHTPLGTKRTQYERTGC